MKTAQIALGVAAGIIVGSIIIWTGKMIFISVMLEETGKAIQQLNHQTKADQDRRQAEYRAQAEARAAEQRRLAAEKQRAIARQQEYERQVAMADHRAKVRQAEQEQARRNLDRLFEAQYQPEPLCKNPSEGMVVYCLKAKKDAKLEFMAELESRPAF